MQHIESLMHVFLNDILKPNMLTSQKLASSNLGRSIGYSTSDGEPLTLVPNLEPNDISISSGDHKVVSSRHLKPPANSTVNHSVILM